MNNLLIFLALGTDTEKIKTVAHDSKACLLGQFLGHIAQGPKVRIHNLSAFCADEMGMGGWPISVVAVAAITKAQFQNFSNLFHDDQSFINGSETRSWEVPFYLPIYCFNAGVSITDSQYF